MFDICVDHLQNLFHQSEQSSQITEPAGCITVSWEAS